MKTEKIGKHKVVYYDAINELPIVRYHIYNKMLLVDGGVGSDVTDFDNHLQRVIGFIQADKKEDAIKELQNVRQNIYLIQNTISPKHLAFAALITEIDGQPRGDISEEGLNATIAIINDTPAEAVEDKLAETKKKIETELQTYFPSVFSDSAEKEFFDLLIKRTKTVLEGIITKTDKKAEVDAITLEMLTFSRPHDFSTEKNVELAADKQFERICIMLSENLMCNPKAYTVLEFYSAFEYLKDKMKKLKN